MSPCEGVLHNMNLPVTRLFTTLPYLVQVIFKALLQSPFFHLSSRIPKRQEALRLGLLPWTQFPGRLSYYGSSSVLCDLSPSELYFHEQKLDV